MSTASKPRLRWFQYRLRSLLLLTAVLCCLLAGPAKRARDQRAVLGAVKGIGGAVLFDWQNPERDFDPGVSSFGQMYFLFSGRVYFETTKLRVAPEPPGPVWLRHLVGDEYFQTIIIVDTGGYVAKDDALAEPVTNDTLRTISRLKSLLWLDIDHATGINDAGIAHLEALTQLERLFADDVPITDRGMKHLEGLTHLEYLSINSPLVTDEGVESLRCLKRMKYLYLGNTKISDRGLDALNGLKSLKWLYVPETSISTEAARRFERSVPGCNVIFCEPGIVG